MEKSVDEIFKVIVSYVEEMSADVDHGPITRTSILSPLGLDSIGRALLIERMMETLELTVPRFEFYQANNFGELAEIFAKKLREKTLAEPPPDRVNILLDWSDAINAHRDFQNGSTIG